MKPLVIYHDNCADGFGAAFAAWLKFRGDAEYLPTQYGEFKGLPPGTDERDVYVLDFSFDRGVTETLLASPKRVIWLDHHKSAFEMWLGQYERAMTYSNAYDPDGDSRHHIVLNDNKSGAMLAWEYFHPGTEVPELFQHIDDRDRRQFKLPGSKQVQAALLAMRPWVFGQWSEIEMPALLRSGAAILAAQDQHVASLLSLASKCEIKQRVPLDNGDYSEGVLGKGYAINSPVFQSDIGQELAKQADFGLLWHQDAHGVVKCSLRSEGDFDVSAIAQVFGGGGRKNAAGFTTDILTLESWL